MGTARDEALREIRHFLDRGDLAAAREAYGRLLDEHPDDWTSVNALGDLHVRAGSAEAAIVQFTRAADHFRDEGFFSKAMALYRKVVKLRPDDHALLNLGDLARQQGLLAEARQYLVELEQLRQSRGDIEGAAECAARRDALVHAATGRGPSARAHDQRPAETQSPAPAMHANSPIVPVEDDHVVLRADATVPAESVSPAADAIEPEADVPQPDASSAASRGGPAKAAPAGSTRRPAARADKPAPLESIFDRLRKDAGQASGAEGQDLVDRAKQLLEEQNDSDAGSTKS